MRINGDLTIALEKEESVLLVKIFKLQNTSSSYSVFSGFEKGLKSILGNSVSRVLSRNVWNFLYFMVEFVTLDDQVQMNLECLVKMSPSGDGWVTGTI